MKKKKNMIPPKEVIEAKKDELLEAIEEAKRSKSKSQTQEFLQEISDVIKKAIDDGVSYKELSRIIYKVYNFKVSEQTIRAFSHNVLGIPKKSRVMATAKSGNDKDKKSDVSGGGGQTIDENGRKKTGFGDI